MVNSHLLIQHQTFLHSLYNSLFFLSALVWSLQMLLNLRTSGFHLTYIHMHVHYNFLLSYVSGYLLSPSSFLLLHCFHNTRSGRLGLLLHSILQMLHFSLHLLILHSIPVNYRLSLFRYCLLH